MKVSSLDEMLGVPRLADDRVTEAVRRTLDGGFSDAEDLDERYTRHIQQRERDASSCLSKDLRGLLEFVPDNPCRPSDTAHDEPPGDYLPDNPEEQAFFLANDFPNMPLNPPLDNLSPAEWAESQTLAQEPSSPLASLIAAWQPMAQAAPDPVSPGLTGLELEPDTPANDTSPEPASAAQPLQAQTTIAIPGYNGPDLPPDPLVTIVQQMSTESYGVGPGLAQLESILNLPPGDLGVQALHAIQKWKRARQLQPPVEEKKSDDNIYYPHTGTIEPHTKKTTSSAPRRNQIAHNSFDHWKDDDMASSYILLRTYEKDIEFAQPTSKHARNWEMNPYFSSALHCRNHDEVATTDLFFGTSRINMLFHIPELCVVVLGSATGRVIVATLTKLAKPQPDASGLSLWNRGMRVEWILPRESDERKHRPLMEARPLLGLAVGRVPETAADATSSRRWRIMLHYQNHLMLSYEITRKEQTEKLCVF